MKTINWLTCEYVAAEAAKGPKEALAVSKLHWLQLSSATLEQLEERFDCPLTLYYYIQAPNCGLCRYYTGDEIINCLLFDGDCCCIEWQAVADAITGDFLAEIYPDFHETSGALNKKIQELK